MQKVYWETFGEVHELDVKIEQYHTGNPAIQLVEYGVPFAKVTINTDEVRGRNDVVVIKNYSENEGALDALVKAKIISHPIGYIRTGLVESPVCELLVKGE